MKVHRKRFRTMRIAAIASCLAGLAVPTVAGAMPLPADPPTSGGRTIAVHHDTAARPVAPSGVGADTLSSQSKTMGARPVWPTDIGADTVSSQSKAPAATRAPVVRVVRTVNDSGDQTLAIALASAALGIALFGAAYALTRAVSIQRRVIGSSS
jgi:hypothetical protein